MPSLPYLFQISVSPGGVPKLPVAEARVSREGVEGDSHRNTELHGGPDRAICLYSLEKLQALQQEGHPIQAGSAGENFTLAGLDWDQLSPGDRLRIGEDVVIEIVSFCAPCKHNARWFLEGKFSRMSQKTHPGWSRLYARVVSEGTVRQGDSIGIERVSQRSVG